MVPLIIVLCLFFSSTVQACTQSCSFTRLVETVHKEDIQKPFFVWVQLKWEKQKSFHCHLESIQHSAFDGAESPSPLHLCLDSVMSSTRKQEAITGRVQPEVISQILYPSKCKGTHNQSYHGFILDAVTTLVQASVDVTAPPPPESFCTDGTCEHVPL